MTREHDAKPVRSVLTFFGLTFLLTAPIWFFSGASGFQILPGLPIAALAVVCPAAAALILAHHRGRPAGGRALLVRAFDAGRIKPAAWWLPILLICPVVAVAAFWILRLSGSEIPDPQIQVGGALGLTVFFLAAALSEELGWSGFALDPLQARWGALAAGLLIGAVWAVWHYPALLQAHRSWDWIAWWTLGTVSMRVIMVWLFNGAGGSVFAAATFHALSNLCWQLFPIQGTWFDPRIHGLLMAALALAIILASAPRSAEYQARARARLASQPPISSSE